MRDQTVQVAASEPKTWTLRPFTLNYTLDLTLYLNLISTLSLPPSLNVSLTIYLNENIQVPAASDRSADGCGL